MLSSLQFTLENHTIKSQKQTHKKCLRLWSWIGLHTSLTLAGATHRPQTGHTLLQCWAAASRSPCSWPVFAWAYWVVIKLEVLICFLIGNILSLPYCARVCYSVYEICLPPYKNNVSHKETHTGLYCMAFKNNVRTNVGNCSAILQRVLWDVL